MTTWIMATAALALQTATPSWNAKVRAEGIAGVAKLLEEGYAYPKVGARLARVIRDREARDDYATVASGVDFARRLTDELQAMSHDKHLWIDFSADKLDPEPPFRIGPPREWMEFARKRFARENYGVPTVQILPGNVGYVDIRLFLPPEIAAETYAAAMATVANTDALIFDLRQCGGSMSPDAIPFLMGYLFAEPTHLSTLKWRTEKEERQYWSASQVPGRRYLDKPVYLLTSGATFSGPEEMAYDLQALKRATLIGETTAGAANPNIMRRASDHFGMSLPSGWVRNPVTGRNWEDVGVQPDFKVSAVAALQMAQTEALRRLREAAPKEDRAYYDDALREVEANAKPIRKVRFVLAGFPDAKRVEVAGTFNYWTPRLGTMRREKGVWTFEADAEAGRIAYKFVIDGKWTPDPANPNHASPDPDSDSVRRVG